MRWTFDVMRDDKFATVKYLHNTFFPKCEQSYNRFMHRDLPPDEMNQTICEVASVLMAKGFDEEQIARMIGLTELKIEDIVDHDK